MTVSVQEIYRQISNLPPEGLGELAAYLEFLRFKFKKTKAKKPSTKPLRIIDLEGILEGYDFSPELLTAARREMWRKFREFSGK